MRKPFVNTEGVSHLRAKSRMTNWLKRAERLSPYCELIPFFWEKNYGIYEELRFHEKDDIYYFECSPGVRDNWDNYRDDFDYLIPEMVFNPAIDRGKILFAPDITVFHKGIPKYLIEIVSTNHVSREKLERIDKFFMGNIEVHEIFADNVLNTRYGQPLKTYRIL